MTLTQSISGSESLGTLGQSNFSINGNGYSISANGVSGITVNSDTTLTLNNIGSVDEDGNIINSINGFYASVGGFINNLGALSVKDCVFYNNKSSSSSGVIRNANKIYDLNGVFINNISNYGPVIQNIGTIYNISGVFKENHSDKGCGTICSHLGSIETITGIFEHNSGDYGGAIDNYRGTITTIKDSVFINNEVKTKGGAIANTGIGEISSIIGCTFNSNSSIVTSSDGGYGGAIYNSGTIGTISATFENNRAKMNETLPTESINQMSGLGGGICNITDAKITNISGIFNSNNADEGGAIYNKGTIENVNGTFTNNIALLRQGGAIFNEGFMNITASEGRDTIFTGNTANGVSNAIFNRNIINLNTDGTKIVFNDAITGDNGNININDSVKPSLTESVIEFNNEVSGNNVNLYGGTIKFGISQSQDGNISIGTFSDDVNFNYNGGNVILQNNIISETNLGNLVLNNDMNLVLDASFGSENRSIDTIKVSGFTPNSYNINISGINILTPTTDKSFSLSPLADIENEVLKESIAQAIRYTGSDISYLPIYRYSVVYTPEDAMLNFNLLEGSYKSYNPAILASPIAAQLGGYLTQLNSYDEAFRNLDMYMLLPKKERDALKYRNKWAQANGNLVFDPTISMYHNTAGWFRPYATFENVPLKNGPRVSNVAYGSFFGGDSDLYELGHGWDGLFGVYGGYNGSHQAYDGVSIYQNGGTLGTIGMAYHGNLFTGLTVNVSANGCEASTMYGSENFSMLMAGIASKTGYNFEFADGKFIIQPNFLISYTFVNTFDYKNSANVKINSDPLHAIQIEPGIKLIGNLKNGWQPYAGVSMIWNIIDKTHFKANDVSLPNLSIKPFVKYGLGIQKRWGQRFTGYFQTYIMNAGRNGVGLQLGFRWALGKDSNLDKKENKQGKIFKKQKTKIDLKSFKK